MSIQFTPDNWQKIKKNYSDWWNHQLDRPLVPVLLKGKDPGRPQPCAPFLTQATCTDLSIPAKDIIDRIDYELSCYEYVGDSFPFFSLSCFGPGVVAAFLGARLDNSTGRVWFHPEKIVPIEELHFTYDANNIWLNRIKEICYEGMQFWQGQVMMGMPDLGGVLDILSTFRPAERLMMDLYDDPDEVKRLIWEIHDLWLKYYEELNSILQPLNPGYCDWGTVYSDKPCYILQSDASYMISPQMFDEFVKPELASMCQTIEHTIYHLDGIGQLNHLDSLLSIPELNAVQWVPGAGKPPQDQWPDVLSKIYSNSKNLHVNVDFDGLDRIIQHIGTEKVIFNYPFYRDISEKTQVLAKLKDYHIE